MMQGIKHIDSYYSATAKPWRLHPALEENEESDVCVVGGGIAGCSTALHLAERGYKVTLLEAQCIGWGASGRSGAQALPGFACGQDKLVKLVGWQNARVLWDISIESLMLMRALIAKHGIDCDWADGHLQVAIKPSQRTDLMALQEELERDYDYRHTRFINIAELQTMLATERYIAGLYDGLSGHLHALNYTLGLAAAAERAGVRFYEGTRAADFTAQGSQVLVNTASTTAPVQTRGTVRCRHLVLCGNAYLNGMAPQLSSKIMNVGTFVIATEPLGETRARRLIANNTAVADMNWVLDYFRLSADHRLLFGGRVSYSGIEAEHEPSATRRRMLNVFPQLEETKIEYFWGGYVDISLNRAPHFGRLAPNVYFLQGFSGHGIALTGMAGKLIAEAIAGSAERFDCFTKIPHRDFPGGALLRRPALILAMLYYRLRDLL